jgi:hypothetical protein
MLLFEKYEIYVQVAWCSEDAAILTTVQPVRFACFTFTSLLIFTPKKLLCLQLVERSFTMHDLSERERTLNMENINEYIHKDLIIMIYAIIFIILISH